MSDPTAKAKHPLIEPEFRISPMAGEEHDVHPRIPLL
jgi:hypothetical protein